MGKKVFVGVDGCRAGWFAVFLDETGKKKNATGKLLSFLSFHS
ncbi:hypothetical protein [Methanosarcina horonobensis]|nr:hypothetical protein [Methanosarcina horonobensis]